MRFADLVVKFSSEGVDKVNNDVNSLEKSLNDVSNAAKKSANAVTSNFNKLKNANASIDRINQSGAGLQQTFIQAASSAVPFGDNIVDLIQTFALFKLAGLSVVSVTEKVVRSFKIANVSLFKGSKTLGDVLFGLSQKLQMSEIPTGLTMSLSRILTPEQFTKINGFLEKIKKGFSNMAMDAEANMIDLGFALGGFGNKISGSQGAILKFVSTIGAFSSAIIGLTGSLIIAAGAIVAFNLAIAKSTVEAAFEFEQLQARLSALKGPEKANDILNFVRRLAEPSNFTTGQLADSAVQLEAFGLNAKRILPIIAQLGMAFGADAEKLRLLTDMFGRLSQGQLPDVQVMAQFGLSKSKLMKEGIKFDAQGSLVSSTREVMAAIEKIVTRDYGKIFNQMANTGNAKLASLLDVFERLKIGIGIQLADAAKGAIGALTNIFIAIEKTGLLEKAAKTMLLPFEALMNAFAAKGTTGIFSNVQIQMASFIATLLAGFEELNIQTALFIERMSLTGKLFADFATMNPQAAVKNFSNLAKNLTGTFAPGRMVEKGTDYAQRLLGMMKFLETSPGANINDLINESKKTDFGKLEDLLKPEKDKDKKDKEKSQRTLDLIQQNTKTANEITLRNLTYGGGQLAAQGISAVQMSGNRTVSSPQISASNDIVRGIEKIVRGYSNSNNLNFSFRRS
jgi:hypothetical protein